MVQTPLRMPAVATLIASAALAIVVAGVVAFAPASAEAAAPVAPNTVSGARSGQTITVDWDAVNSATKYNINHSNDAKRTWQRTKSGHTSCNNNSCEYNVQGTWLNADYTFAVQACDDNDQCSGWKQSSLVPGQNKPNAPSVVHVKHKGTWVKFWWPKPSGGASTYDIVASTNHKASWSRLFTGYRQNVAHITNGDRNKTYYIAVRACNSKGCSGWRNSAGAQKLEPNDVASVNASFTGAELTANWPATPGATKYHATYACQKGQSLAFGNDHTNITGTSRTFPVDTSKTNDGATADGCWVGVRAGNDHGWSKWKNSAAATRTPEAPTSLQVENSVGYWHLKWNHENRGHGDTYEVQSKVGDTDTFSGPEYTNESSERKIISEKKANFVHSKDVNSAHTVYRCTADTTCNILEENGWAKQHNGIFTVTAKREFRVRACNDGRCSEWETGGLEPAQPTANNLQADTITATAGCDGTNPKINLEIPIRNAHVSAPNLIPNASSLHIVYRKDGESGYPRTLNTELMTSRETRYWTPGGSVGTVVEYIRAKMTNLDQGTEYTVDIAPRNAASTDLPWKNLAVSATTGNCSS